MTENAKPWYELAFGARYDEVYSHRDDPSAAREIEWIADRLEIDPRAVVLDVGCGNGRHLAAWADRGHSAIGIDLSESLVAKARARQLPNTCVLQGDMRQLGFDGHFDLATNLFTSFGYFEGDDDRRVLEGIHRALRPKANLVLDYLNADYVRAHLVPHSERELAGRFIKETRHIDEDRGRVEKDVLIRESDGTETRYRESVRLYAETDLRQLLRENGFEVQSVYGGLDGQRLSPDSTRLVLFAQRLGDH
jgi:SAM-dependent methyltransferase